MLQFMQNHEVAIGFAAVYVLVAMVTSLPERRQDFDLYGWVYHWTHQCINALPAKYQMKDSK